VIMMYILIAFVPILHHYKSSLHVILGIEGW
jgi:hypothetical protein